MAMDDSIAVIIPAYNRVNTLQRALDSVFAQTAAQTFPRTFSRAFPRTTAVQEICVVDDGSSDGTRELIAHNYPTVGYVYQENSGVSAARNTGVKNTSSSWLAFLDSDDKWLPQKLQLQLELLRENPEYKLVHSDEVWIRNGKRVNQGRKHQKRGGYIFPFCLPRCVISPSSVVLHRGLFAEIQGFDESLPACEDYDLWLKICSQQEVLYIDKPLLAKYGGHEDQLSKLHWGMDRFRLKSIANLLASSTLDNTQRKLAISTLREKAEILKNGALKRGKLDVVRYYEQLIQEYV